MATVDRVVQVEKHLGRVLHLLVDLDHSGVYVRTVRGHRPSDAFPSAQPVSPCPKRHLHHLVHLAGLQSPARSLLRDRNKRRLQILRDEEKRREAPLHHRHHHVHSLVLPTHVHHRRDLSPHWPGSTPSEQIRNLLSFHRIELVNTFE